MRIIKGDRWEQVGVAATSKRNEPRVSTSSDLNSWEFFLRSSCFQLPFLSTCMYLLRRVHHHHLGFPQLSSSCIPWSLLVGHAELEQNRDVGVLQAVGSMTL